MEQKEVNLAKQLKGVWRFKWIIALMVLIAGGISLGFTLMRPPVYEATTTVMVESGQPTLALPAELGITYSQDIGSQIEVMRSRSVLERAVSQFEPDKSTNPQYLQSEVEKLQESLKIQQVKGTSLVAVTIVSSDPSTAQKQADAVAAAYVYEANSAMSTAMETALENATKQLKELSVSKVDISISPSLTRLTAQIDIALADLEVVSEHLEQIESQDAVTSSGLISNITNQISTAVSRTNRLSALARNIQFESFDLDIIVSQTMALAINIQTIADQIEMMQNSETDPQVHSELLNVEELVRLASTAIEMILEQMTTLSAALYEQDLYEQQGIQTELDMSQLYQDSQDLVVQNAELAANALETTLDFLPKTATITQQQLEILNERTTSATTTLQALSKQLKMPDAEQGILLTYAELATIENRARTLVTTINSLLSEVKEMRLNEPDPQVYAELYNIEELVISANDAISELPDAMSDLASGGGGSLSYTALYNLRQELQLALLIGDSSEIRVVDIAVVYSPDSDFFGRYKNVILAVAAALLLGILSALILQYFDRRVRDASQVADYVGLPALAHIARTWAIGNSRYPSVLNKNAPQYLEAFRMLRTNLGLDSYEGQILLISSPDEKEGKTTVAANLARVVALQGRSVLLVDGSLRKPDIAPVFNLAESNGFSEFLTSEKEPWDYVAKADSVDILASRTESAESAEILSSLRMIELLQKARQTYDVVIVDSAPVLGYADTKILARMVDEALLILQPDVSRLDLAKDSKQALEAMGVKVVGFALNKVKPRKYKY
jgi:capsular exopolysaccharide synthesis family protein